MRIGIGGSYSHTNLLHSCILWQGYDILLPGEATIKGCKVGKNEVPLFAATLVESFHATSEYSIQKAFAS